MKSREEAIEIHIDLSPFSEEELHSFFSESIISKSELVNELAKRRKLSEKQRINQIIESIRQKIGDTEHE